MTDIPITSNLEYRSSSVEAIRMPDVGIEIAVIKGASYLLDFKRHAVLAHLTPKEDSPGYVAEALNLEGVITEGDTEQEALEHIHEASLGIIQSYLEDGEEVPWIPGTHRTECRDPEGNEILKWVIVDV